jgi:hypothetical protein
VLLVVIDFHRLCSVPDPVILSFSVLCSSLASPVPVWVQSPEVLLERLAVCVWSGSCRRLFTLRSDLRPRVKLFGRVNLTRRSV